MRLGMLLAGKFIDKVGTKSGYAWALFGWSIAAIGHAFGHHTWSFGFWRAALGVTEAGNFPAANKAVAEWFPKKERAFATGLYNSGANIGSIVAPLTVPYIANAWGWEWAFILTGVIGLTWLAFWYALYASPAAKLQSGKLSPGGIRLHPQRRGRAGGRESRCGKGKSLVVQTAYVPADVGILRRQIPDRPDLVVLPLLAALVS